MKIRTGFISNSSSSSFVVAFWHQPKDEDDVRQMVFGRKRVAERWDHKATTKDLSKVIFDKIQLEVKHNDQTKLISYLVDEFCNRYYSEHYDYSYLSHQINFKYSKPEYFGMDPKLFKEAYDLMDEYSELYDKIYDVDIDTSKRQEQLAQLKALQDKKDKAVLFSALIDVMTFIKDNPDCFIVKLHFSDNGAGVEELILESGECFNKLNFVMIDNH